MLQYIWTKKTVLTCFNCFKLFLKEPSKNSFEFVHSARDPVHKNFSVKVGCIYIERSSH